MIKIKDSTNNANAPIDPSKSIVYEYRPTTSGVPNPPSNLPFGMPNYSYVAANPIRLPQPPPIDMPEANLPRSINYYADYGGCGYWRMIWPEFCLNSYNKSVISGLTCMVLDLRFYQGLKTIRMQRQATPVQNAFIKELVKAKPQMGYKMVYEVDDIVFKDDIPDYNRCKDAFINQDIIDSILEIMGMMDEITVTCQYMKEYYMEKTGNKKITVIPNYPPKFWLDRFYNKQRIEELYDRHKKRPRVLYAGSGTHIDVTNRTGMKDDFSHVIDEIIKARKKFKFVWKGCFPLAVKPFIDNGEMEYVDWSPLMDLPKDIYQIGANVAFAPLVDNNFNKAKSNIKMVEAGAFGMPGAYQDLCTYKDADIKFNNGKDLISQLEYITSDFDRYMDLSAGARKFTEGLWLEDHLDEYDALYNTNWGSKERNEKSKILVENNPEQRV
jgi:hypothetical protein